MPKQSDHLYKTKAERVQEAVMILSKLKQIRVGVTNPGYVEVKKYMDEWIKDGEYKSYLFDFPFPLERKAELILPKKKMVPASLRLIGTGENKIDE